MRLPGDSDCNVMGEFVTFTVDASSADMAGLRDRIQTALANVEPAELTDVMLVVSELLSNGVEYSTGELTCVVERVDPESIRLSTSNTAPAGSVQPAAEWLLPEPLAPRGRGLGIVAAIARTAEVTWADGIVTIDVVLPARHQA